MSETSPATLHTVAVICAVIPAFVVYLRLYARHVMKLPLLWDDWLIIFSLVSIASCNYASFAIDSNVAVMHDARRCYHGR